MTAQERAQRLSSDAGTGSITTATESHAMSDMFGSSEVSLSPRRDEGDLDDEPLDDDLDDELDDDLDDDPDDEDA